LRRVMRGRRVVLGLQILRVPLPGASGALGQLPVVAEQHVEVAVVPLDRIRGPRAFDAGGDGVVALAAAVRADPAETLLGDVGALGLRADLGGVTATVRLAEGVATGGQRDGLL